MLEKSIIDNTIHIHKRGLVLTLRYTNAIDCNCILECNRATAGLQEKKVVETSEGG